MKIAVLAHVRQPIAQPFSGGMEAYTWRLMEGLRARGHDAVLFASGDSDSRFPIEPVLERHYEADFPWVEHKGSPELIAHVDSGYETACQTIAEGDFDVVHNNSLSRLPLQARWTDRVPTLTSLHVPPFPALHGFVRDSARLSHHLTVVSGRQRHIWWPDGAPPGVSVLPNAVDEAAWPFTPVGDGTAVWCGRISANKGTHYAIAAARIAGLSLTVFGPIEEPEYWADSVAPAMGGSVRYGGHLHSEALAREVGRASVLFFTPCWDEPFGLVAIEAMSCGVPVASFDSGAAQEVIGEAGVYCVRADAKGLAWAAGAALRIPRNVPRERVERLYTQEAWLVRCECLYRHLMSRSAPGTSIRVNQPTLRRPGNADGLISNND